MLSLHIENIGEAAIIECAGRIVQSESAFELRRAVMSQQDAQVIVLDLTRLWAIGGGGVGMVWYLQRWARDHDIKLKIFNPPYSVRERLLNFSRTPELEIAKLEEVMALLGGGVQSETRLAA
jgi:anti-anti-sigma regulatory factor